MINDNELEIGDSVERVIRSKRSKYNNIREGLVYKKNQLASQENVYTNLINYNDDATKLARNERS